MDNNEVKAIFYKAFHGNTNFMTPVVVSYGKVPTRDLVYEISSSRAGKAIYAVTFLTTAGQLQTNIGKFGFDSVQEVEEYINTLIKSDK